MRSSAVGGTDWTLQSCPSARPSVIRRWLHDGSSAWVFCLSDACSARSWLIHFANGSTAIQSFSAAFVLDIVSNYTGFSTHRMAIAVALTTASLSAVLTDKYLVGRASPTRQDDDGNATINHLLAVELDIIRIASAPKSRTLLLSYPCNLSTTGPGTPGTMSSAVALARIGAWLRRHLAASSAAAAAVAVRPSVRDRGDRPAARERGAGPRERGAGPRRRRYRGPSRAANRRSRSGHTGSHTGNCSTPPRGSRTGTSSAPAASAAPCRRPRRRRFPRLPGP